MATHRFGAAEYAGDRLSSGVGSLLLLSFFFLFFFFFLGVVRSPACLPACALSLSLSLSSHQVAGSLAWL